VFSRALPALLLAWVALVPGTGYADDLAIMNRAAWGAAVPVLAMKRHKPVRLTLHHTATRQNPKTGLKTKLRNLQRFSQSRAKLSDGRTKKRWADIPYHYYIAADGGIGEGREVAFVGDTNTRYDPTGHIGIVLEGNFEREKPTAAQVEATVRLLAYLARRHNIAPERIGGHRDVARTACPGRALEALLPTIRERVADALVR